MPVSDLAARPLQRRYPRLAEALPIVELASLPTPLRRMEKLGEHASLRELYLKDDGPSSASYGGNKVRKLEFLLGQARSRGALEVMTFGYAGSNHATATAVHAAALGMRSISMLMPQENAAYLRTNLLVSAAAGAELHEYATTARVVAGVAKQMLLHRMRTGQFPYRIDPGGSSALGTVGFVAAAFELAEQMQGEGIAPPRAVYVAGGSMGSAVGLALGFAMLGMPPRVLAVRVTDAQYVNLERGRKLWDATVALLARSDPSIRPLLFDAAALEICEGFDGGVYARPTAESDEATALAQRLESLKLDVSYTAKTMACLLQHAGERRHGDGPVVFWNTCNSADLSAAASRAGTRDLPPRLRRYFDGDLR